MSKIKVGTKCLTTRFMNVQNIDTGMLVMLSTDTKCIVEKITETSRYDTMCLITCEKVHGWVMEDALEPTMITDKYGHELYWVDGKEAAEIIAKAFINGDVRKIYVGSDREEPSELDDLEAVCGWSEIREVDLPFDNTSEEMVLMMGYLGGGYVGSAYYDGESADWFAAQIKDMMEKVTGNSGDNKYFLQLIATDYAGNESNEL